jgi:hypothetical protein
MARRAAIAVVAALLAAPAPAEAQSPFQSAPGPAPPPVHHPAPRHRVEPELPPEPAPPPPPPPPDPAKRFDGLWTGQYSCGPGRNMPAFTRPMVGEVKNGQFAFVNVVPAGRPGSWAGSGTIAPDGSLSLVVEGVARGVPGTPYASGDHFTHQLRGRFDGDRFTAADLDGSGRGCGISMTRRQ